MSVVRNVAVRIGGDSTGLIRTFRNAQRASNDFKSHFQTASDGINSVGNTLLQKVSLPIAAIGGLSIANAAIFEQSMSKVGALSKAVGKDFEMMEDKAREMGKTTSKTATEAADAMSYMALAGWDSTQIIAGIEPILRLAEAGNLDLARSSDLVTDSMSSLGLQAKDLSGFLDLVANTSRSSNTDIDVMMEAFNIAGGQFKDLNVSLEEASTWLGVLANRGLKGSEAGTSLNSILLNMTTGAGQAGKMIKDVGLKVYDSTGKFRGMENVLKDLYNITKNMSDKRRQEVLGAIGGKTQIDTLQKLLGGVNDVDGEFDKLYANIKNSDGALKEMYTTMQDNLIGQFNKMKSSIESVTIDLGNVLLPVVKKVVSGITFLADKFGSLSDKTKTTTVIISAIVATIPILISLVGTVAAAIAGLVTVFGAITAPVLLFAGALFGIGAIVLEYSAWFGLLYAKNEGFKNSINDLASNIKEKFIIFKNVVSNVINRVVSIYRDHEVKIKEFVSVFVDNISIGINLINSLLSGDLSKAFDIAIDLHNNLIKTISLAMQNLLPVLGAITKEIVKNIPLILSKLTNKIDEQFSLLGLNIINRINNLKTNLEEKFDTFKESLPGKIQETTIKINEKISRWIESFPGKAKKATIDFVNSMFSSEDSKVIGDNTNKAMGKVLEKVDENKPTIKKAIVELIWSITKELGKLSIVAAKEVGKMFVSMIFTINFKTIEMLETVYTKVVTGIETKLDNLKMIGVKAGIKLITGLKSGFDEKVGELKTKVSNITNMIGNFFPRSPAKEGALKYANQWGSKIISQLNEGFLKSSPELKSVVKKVSDNAVINPSIKKDVMNSIIKDFKMMEGEAKKGKDKKPSEMLKDFNYEVNNYMDNLNNSLTGRINEVRNKINGVFESFSLFEKVDKDYVSKSGLIANLKTQVKVMDEFKSGLENLKSKLGSDSNIYQKFVDYGVKSADELKAINSMSEQQLKEYSNLFSSKMELSKDLAKTELRQQVDLVQKVRDIAVTITGNSVREDNDIDKITNQVAEKLAYEL